MDWVFDFFNLDFDDELSYNFKDDNLNLSKLDNFWIDGIRLIRWLLSVDNWLFDDMILWLIEILDNWLLEIWWIDE